MRRSFIDDLNMQTMQDSVFYYSGASTLTKPELAALDSLVDVNGKPVLDIGIGGGRTVEALRNISNDYVGIDYVAEMVEECKRKFPGVRFEQCDARKLSFADNTFQVVLFSMNGISMVDHEGRLEILKEVFRVLRPGGYFLFSTYNRDFPGYQDLFRMSDFIRMSEFSFSLNPLKFYHANKYPIYNLLVSLRNRFRFRKMEVHASEYSIVNDRCHNYATMLYYITRSNQFKQLKSVGFGENILTFDANGDVFTEATPFDSIFYLARKPEHSPQN